MNNNSATGCSILLSRADGDLSVRVHRRLHVLPLVLLMVLAACGEAKETPPPVIRGVLTMAVASPGAAQERVFSGLARSGSTTDLSFRVAGEITSLHVKPGDVVQPGVLIAELDPTDYRIEVEEARASLTEAQAQARNEEADYERVRALYERESASERARDAARASAESSRANVAAAEQRLQRAEQKLEYTQLRAPSGGAISVVPVELSENVTVGQTVAILQTGGPPEVEVAIPEVLIAGITAGQSVSIRFDAFPDEIYQGTVREVGVAPTDGGTTFPVVVKVDAWWERIRPGMAVQVTFRFASSGSQHVTVPPSAIGHDRQGHYVFLVEPDVEGFGTTVRQALVIGDVTGGGITVLSGLEGGETIVVAGVPRVEEGLRVRILREGDWP